MPIHYAAINPDPETLALLLAAGGHRARSYCRFVLPLIHFIPGSLTYSVPLFLKRQCDRTLGAHPDVQTLEGQTCLHFAALWQHVEVAEP